MSDAPACRAKPVVLGLAFEAHQLAPMASLEDDVVEVARARGRVAGKGRAVPTSHGNDEMRAARCALGMIERRRRLSEESGRTVEIGIGVAYGELVAGCMGSEDRLNYTVLSDRVNLASRLCSVAERGEVLVDGSVAGALGDEFRAERREPVALKGFSEPVEVFALSFDRPARLDATKGRA